MAIVYPYFIVIEGIDGSGKATYSGKLCRDLKTNPHSFNIRNKRFILRTDEPTSGKIGKLIREYLKDKDLVDKESLSLLFAADRLVHLTHNIIPALSKGGIVISERYVYSSLAYQSAEGVDMEWLCMINRSIVTPDLVIWLDLDPEIAISRIKSKSGVRIYDDMEYFEKRRLLQDSIRKNYINITNKITNIKGKYDFLDTTFCKVDNSRPIDEVYRDIKTYVRNLFDHKYPLHSFKDVKLKTINTKKLTFDDLLVVK
ncbi:MAG: dTMP kinase [Methanocellales archaeon]|nr:dTMP kinase [Methanocellales archaeon]